MAEVNEGRGMRISIRTLPVDFPRTEAALALQASILYELNDPRATSSWHYFSEECDGTGSCPLSPLALGIVTE